MSQGSLTNLTDPIPEELLKDRYDHNINIEVHVSEMKQFLACRRQWYYASHNARNLEPKRVIMPLYTGTAVHYALEAYYKHGTSPLSAYAQFHNEYIAELKADPSMVDSPFWDEQFNEFEAEYEMMKVVMLHYQMWAPEHDYEWEWIAHEKDFQVQLSAPSPGLAPALWYSGRFDGVVRYRPTGELYLWETKTQASLADDHLDNDFQASTYAWIAEQVLHEPISGIVYNLIRKKVPAEPRILNSGQVSLASKQDTTHWWWAASMRQMGYNPDDPKYFEFVRTLEEERKDTFFRRYIVTRNSYEHLSTAAMVFGIANDIYAAMKGNLQLYPAPDMFKCRMCSFKHPCLAMNDGSDWETMLREDYRPRRNRKEPTAEA